MSGTCEAAMQRPAERRKLADVWVASAACPDSVVLCGALAINGLVVTSVSPG